ncbi:MAG TPA: zinc-binding dehydrogenase [Desulfobacterales bacterium]
MQATTGRAAVMTAPGQPLEIRRYPLPRVEPGAILVRVTCCTICGSDLHSWSGRRPAPLPIVLGHEIVGTVAALGDGVQCDCGDRDLAVGDRITWTIMDSCGKCYYCREKMLPMKCRRLKKYGHDRCSDPPHFVGGFAEYCYLTPGTCVIKVPAQIPDTVAAPANCALATVMAGWEAGRIRPMENVLIQGAGALGIYAAAVARHAGCRRIVVTDVLDRRLELIRQFGATDTINVVEMTDEQVVGAVRSLTEDFGVDCVLEVAGSPELIPLGLRCLRIGGRCIEMGNSFPDARFGYDASDIVWRRLTLSGVHNYDAVHLQQAVDFLAATADKYPFEQIVSGPFSLDDIDAARQTAASKEAIRVAVVP